jgi:hypothetical protein
MRAPAARLGLDLHVQAVLGEDAVVDREVQGQVAQAVDRLRNQQDGAGCLPGRLGGIVFRMVARRSGAP